MSYREREKAPASPKVAAAIMAACIVCAPLTARFEGKRNKPYLDPVGIPTVCYGETQVEMRVYSNDECGRMLRQALAKRYAPKVAQCLPMLTAPERKHEFAAMIDSSYNAGPGAICSSSMARHFRANQWTAGCNALRTFYVGSVTKAPVRGAMSVRRITSGKNKGMYFNTFRGIVDRRAVFADLCLKPE